MVFTKSNPPSGFYVYAYIREDGSPYYIGKGKNKRAWKHYSGYNTTPKNESRVVILEHNLSEEESFALEQSLISQYGRKDLGTGILNNRTNGGEGPAGVKRTEEQKQAQRKPKHPGHGANVSKSLTGYKQTDTHKAKYKNRVPVNKGVTGVVTFTQKQLTCPHCNKTGGATCMRRWHFNNCKLPGFKNN